jgi:hypothetical protein
MRTESLITQAAVSRPRAAVTAGRRWRRWAAPLGLLCAVSVLHTLAGVHPDLVERYYSRHVYFYIVRGLAYANKFVNFSLAELLALTILAGLAAGAIWQARRLYLRRVGAGELALSVLRILLWAAGAGAALFLLTWGLNYQRRPLADSLQLERRLPRRNELEAIGRTVVEGINQNYFDSLAERERGRPDRPPLGGPQLYEVLESSYQRQAPLWGGDFGPPKPVYFSSLMSRFSVSGIYIPFTGEANFNAEQPDSDLPFSVAHEMAHQRGYAREDEADFIAFLVCINSSHPYVRYSGYLHATNVLGVLARVEPRRYAEFVGALAPGARADIDASNAFWLRNEGHLSQATYKVTDTYLKLNRVEAGLRSYNGVVALIVRYYLTYPAGTTIGLSDSLLQGTSASPLPTDS